MIMGQIGLVAKQVNAIKADKRRPFLPFMKALKIHPSNFTWQLWRGGTLLDLGVPSNIAKFIIEKKAVLQKYVIGYCNGTSLPCRPKNNTYAVMFQKGCLQFWTHLTIEEFNRVIGKLK